VRDIYGNAKSPGLELTYTISAVRVDGFRELRESARCQTNHAAQHAMHTET